MIPSSGGAKRLFDVAERRLFWIAAASRAVQSVISNSRFSLATMTERVELHCARSDFPNLTPITAQFASSDVFR